MLGDSLRRRYGAHRQPTSEGEDRPPRPERPGRRDRLLGLAWWQWPLVAAGVLLVSFGVGYLLSTQVLFPRPETAGTGIAVPALYGEMWTEAEATLREAGLVPGDVTEVASLDAERGRVLAQSPIPDQQLRSGGVVSLGVSGGAPELRIPPVRGMAAETARELLERVGFEVEEKQVRGETVAVGAVTRTDPAAGEARTPPTVVTLFVNTAPPADSVEGGVPAGVPADTTPEDVSPLSGGSGAPAGGGA